MSSVALSLAQRLALRPREFNSERPRAAIKALAALPDVGGGARYLFDQRSPHAQQALVLVDRFPKFFSKLGIERGKAGTVWIADGKAMAGRIERMRRAHHPLAPTYAPVELPREATGADYARVLPKRLYPVVAPSARGYFFGHDAIDHVTGVALLPPEVADLADARIRLSQTLRAIVTSAPASAYRNQWLSALDRYPGEGQAHHFDGATSGITAALFNRLDARERARALAHALRDVTCGSSHLEAWLALEARPGAPFMPQVNEALRTGAFPGLSRGELKALADRILSKLC
jgi:hypothetical protein